MDDLFRAGFHQLSTVCNYIKMTFLNKLKTPININVVRVISQQVIQRQKICVFVMERKIATR